MTELIVAQKKAFNEFVLRDLRNKKEHTFGLEFIKVPTPGVGEIICLNRELLNTQSELFSKNYIFGELTSEYGRKITSKTDPDLAVIKVKNDRIFLKRLYG